MKAVVLAYHNIGCTGVRALLQHGVTIQAIFTHKEDPDENLWFDSVEQLAAENDIPVLAPENINHPLWIERIRDLSPDILFSFYYRKMVGKDILHIPKMGCFNLHGSLLPKYRGRCPVNWVLVNGEKETGVTLHRMTPKPDNGDIISQRRIDISFTDTALTLHKKLTSAAGRLLEEIIPALMTGNFPSTVQVQAQASYFGGRKPADGEIDWHRSNERVYNLVRAVTKPYPGAFSYLGDRKVIFWSASLEEDHSDQQPGTILSTTPLVIKCSDGSLKVHAGQTEAGLYMSGKQLVDEVGLAVGMRFGQKRSRSFGQKIKKHVLILGADGFIGNHLSERLLDSGRYEVHAMDLSSNSIGRLFGTPGFHFSEGDISIHREWIEYHVRKCDIILPLVAIATPAEYVRNPLKVFELDFEENLRIVRYCAKYGKRIIFPSTSEVYGMCQESEFDEEKSKLVLGPIHKQRWIYSCSKQLLDRVIWAYGVTKGLQFTLIRPFNWVGPRLDNLESARIGSSRVITKLILNLVEGTPIRLVDGGAQKRCFTDVKDGISCLFKIIENKDRCCDSRIFNIGNPDNEASISELAHLLTEKFEAHPLRREFPPLAGIQSVESREFYGPGYEDVQHRRPSIRLARQLLDWEPKILLAQSVEETLDYFLKQAIETQER
ncbi:bifunctional UDP-4-amino-4-deoxy-L-arabinose formyltransferase/UDP-glucuronic acid oxidase ArnA [Desulfopila sp. IMCC35006]|uniref:bifunctional UDP-4-amino-4-deoxy-L-arabinose formyltransferase/UDP-glucuronic acid oxidase ArnA n=1 Tax=Desulfopila sp. IMCC35006 TaxID=2569542 RepID=UPI0010AD5E12|nr:bifunctional UDP-4-amino-4-deoxy-L-arabinose formyltransferase/UDP-glucuronic acid oxidase ArnA [Desulfopila sp. IMCC35006]TKB24269.1 bifunctional UDP-4-amino-4-deoxy-L-arabinose formyltransferase/UDP-glucuronic acid oxidase ArnA [Desulfopila sp. IMCC35006]